MPSEKLLKKGLMFMWEVWIVELHRYNLLAKHTIKLVGLFDDAYDKQSFGEI